MEVFIKLWRLSTRKLYEFLWKFWVEWCIDRDLELIILYVNRMLEFLYYLNIEKNMAWFTIKVVRFVVCFILSVGERDNIASYLLVIRYI